jgi:hypothetical protein
MAPGRWASVLGELTCKTQPNDVRIEIEDAADAFEGARPSALAGENPAPHLLVLAAAVPVRSETIPLKAVNRVLENGNHEPLFGGLSGAPGCDASRRLDDVAHRATSFGPHALPIWGAKPWCNLGLLRAWLYVGRPTPTPRPAGAASARRAPPRRPARARHRTSASGLPTHPASLLSTRVDPIRVRPPPRGPAGRPRTRSSSRAPSGGALRPCGR